jgi:biofilm protein TabA
MIIAFSASASKLPNSGKSIDTEQTDPKNWTDAQLNSWYEKQDWLNGWQVKSDGSNDKRLLAESYFKFKDRWDMTFQFLKNNDLTKLSGNHEIDGKNVHIIVADYNSKEKSQTRYESHDKYVDIQYVAVGEEYMGKTTRDLAKVSVPYNQPNDITFYDFDGGDYFKATPESFFIFFPEEVHRPSIKIDESVPIKRIVVKILVE